jgi:hypothetical protein
MYVMKDSGYIIDRHKRIMVFKHIIHSIVTKYGDVMPPPDHAAPTDSKSNTATGVFASLGIEKPPRNLAHKGGSFRRESQVRFQHFSAQPQAIDVAEGLQFDIRALCGPSIVYVWSGTLFIACYYGTRRSPIAG